MSDLDEDVKKHGGITDGDTVNNENNCDEKSDTQRAQDLSMSAEEQAMHRQRTRYFEKRALYGVLVILFTALTAVFLFDILLLPLITYALTEPISCLADIICGLRFGGMIDGFADEIFGQLYEIVPYILLMGFQLIALSAAANIAKRGGLLPQCGVCAEDDGDKSFTYRNLLPLIFFALFSSILISWLVGIFTEDRFSGESVFPTTDVGRLLYFVSVALLAPILEELAYRGILMRTLLPFGRRLAIVVSAAVFAAGHAGVSGIAYAFVWGIFFGIIAVNTGSVLPGIIIHFVNNGISVFAVEYLQASYPQYAELISLCVSLAYMFLGFVSLYLLFGRRKRLAVRDGYSGLLSERERFSQIANPMLLLYFGFQLLFTLLDMIMQRAQG